MNNVRNLIILRARNPPSKIQRIKESKISKNARGGYVCIVYPCRVYIYIALCVASVRTVCNPPSKSQDNSTAPRV